MTKTKILFQNKNKTFVIGFYKSILIKPTTFSQPLVAICSKARVWRLALASDVFHYPD
jgi:hypothetical protein